MDSWRADLQFAASSFRRARGFAAVAILTLAVGVGSSATMFAVVNGVVLEPLPFPSSDRLVWVTVNVNIFPDAWMGMAPGMVLPAKAMNDVIADAAIYSREPQRLALTGEGEPERVAVLSVSADFFNVLGVSPGVGRSFAESDVDAASHDGPVLVLSHAFWTRRFGADPTVVGQPLVLDGREYAVLGVMPAGFEYPLAEVEAWSAMVVGDRYGGYGANGIARLRDDVTLPEAEARLNQMVPRLPEMFPESRLARSAIERETRLAVTPLKDVIVWGPVRKVMWVVFGAMVFVLLMACANVVGLFLARAEGRRREVAVRSALGAGRTRLVTHFFAEGLTLAAIGGLLGLGICSLAVPLIRRYGPLELPRLTEIEVDAKTVAFVGLATLLGAAAFALVGLGVRSLATANLLSGRAIGGVGGRGYMRRALVAGQTAFALILLVGAGLMIQSFRNLTRVDPGFDPSDVLSFDIRMGANHPDRADRAVLQGDLLAHLTGLPGVDRVGAATCIPLRDRCPGGTNLREKDVLVVEGDPPILPTSRATATPGFFDALRVPLLKGRFFRDSPDDSLSVVLSAALAQDRWPGEDAIGRIVALGDWSAPEPAGWYTVVGVVGDLPVYMNLAPQPSELRRVIYFPPNAPDSDLRAMTIVMRTSVSPRAIIPAARRAAWALDPDLPVDRIATMEDYVRTSRAPLAFFMTLVVAGGGVALLLALVGVFGVVAQTVGRRTGEIGVRMALGATASQVSLMVVQEGAIPIGVGAAAGLIGALAMNRVMDAAVFGVSATNPVTYLVTSMGLVVLALASAYVPARRAARIDPVAALSEE